MTMFSITTDYFHRHRISFGLPNRDNVLFDLDFDRIRYFSSQHYN